VKAERADLKKKGGLGDSTGPAFDVETYITPVVAEEDTHLDANAANDILKAAEGHFASDSDSGSGSNSDDE
jgi:hypothetical protein